MMQNTLLFLASVGISFAAQAQVDTVRASTLPGPQLAEKAYNSGLASFNQQSQLATLASFDQAIAVKPDFAAAYTNRAATRCELKEYPQTLIDYDQALKLEMTGHTDDVGEAAMNQYLSQHRAQAVVA